MCAADDLGHREQVWPNTDGGVVSRIAAALRDASAWLVLTHEKPDGDAIGCSVALARVGARLGKKTTVGSADEIPERYRFICEDIDYRTLSAIPELAEDMAIVCVDTSNKARAIPGLLEARERYTTINVDHHGDNERFAGINWVEENASATGELVTWLILEAGWGLEADEAEALYVALVSDNGNFSFASTSYMSHLTAIELLKAGASPSRIAERLEVNLSMGALHLWGHAFHRTEVFGAKSARGECPCALFWLTNDDFIGTNTTKQDTENLVNYLLRIKGVRLAALCSETESGVRASLRTRAPFNARSIAAAFGGGGHELAAGCTINHPIAEAISLLKAEMERHADTGPTGSE